MYSLCLIVVERLRQRVKIHIKARSKIRRSKHKEWYQISMLSEMVNLLQLVPLQINSLQQHRRGSASIWVTEERFTLISSDSSTGHL
jgi:hypothetical protein